MTSRRTRRRLQQEKPDLERREFLWKGACAALAAAGIASTIWDLRLVNAAAAHSIRFGSPKKSKFPPVGGSTTPDYKALVCIFLFGGNDGNNWLIPSDNTRYTNLYQPQRGVLAVPQSNLLALNPLTSDGYSYGLHPNCPELAALFNTGKAAFVCNVGTLLAPITKTQYQNGSVGQPPQLFSHNDQQLEWQTSVEDQQPKTGWGGRSADLLYSLNGNNNVSMNISFS